MSARLLLSMMSQLEEVPRINAAIEEFAQTEDWPPELEFQINLVVEELIMNVIKHGHSGSHDTTAVAEIDIVSDPKAVTVNIVDRGLPFDPLTEAPEPDLDSGLADRPIGGLGVHFVRSIMDEARYCRDGDRNRMTIVKQRTG